MKTTLHDILDGDLSESNEDGLFQLPEERHEFAEHGKLREALRLNADVAGLTSAEKAEIGAGLAVAIGLTPAISTTGAPAAGTTVSAGSGWYLKGLAALILGIVIGAGLFMILGNGPETVERTVGIPVQTAVPSAVPFGVPEPAAGAGCDSLVDQLRDSLKILQSQAKGKAKKKGGRNLWMPEDPTTGDTDTRLK